MSILLLYCDINKTGEVIKKPPVVLQVAFLMITQTLQYVNYSLELKLCE